MDSETKVNEEYNNNPQGSGLRRRPKNRWLNCVQQLLTNANYKLEREVKNRADWEKTGSEDPHWTVVPSKKKKKKQ
jgi:epoxyqueuosine reductase QueG